MNMTLFIPNVLSVTDMCISQISYDYKSQELMWGCLKSFISMPVTRCGNIEVQRLSSEAKIYLGILSQLMYLPLFADIPSNWNIF